MVILPILSISLSEFPQYASTVFSSLIVRKPTSPTSQNCAIASIFIKIDCQALPFPPCCSRAETACQQASHSFEQSADRAFVYIERQRSLTLTANSLAMF
jgi:hypothetical protein